MTPEETRRAAEVMLAWADGKKIQIRHKSCLSWNDLNHGENFDWDWHEYEFRIKPGPKVIWVNEYAGARLFIYNSPGEAERYAGTGAVRTAVKYVEAVE
jgi:hypothetical protein